MFAVQELQITTLSRRPSTWVHGNNDFKTRIGETFAYLPASLDFQKLCYPSMPGMFTDIDVHRLCMLVGGYLLDCCRTHRDGVRVIVIRPEKTHRDGVRVIVIRPERTHRDGVRVIVIRTERADGDCACGVFIREGTDVCVTFSDQTELTDMVCV